MSKLPARVRQLELLAPAADRATAEAAIMHGADAVYIGGPSHGARKKAANSTAEIAELVKMAHRYRARVYVTLNTLVYESELKDVERLVWELYRVGVDALIVQDMALLEMNLPPIALHASTQCDTRTPAKARFLQDAGFSQIVLARELSISEIRGICNTVEVPVECFIHGALCVSYSGRCGASCHALGRSANRGECAQMCRMPYTLINGRGETLARNRYLLSLRDFNASTLLGEMIEAGVSSFKIEGRLKEADYVKNVTAYYNKLLNNFIAAHPEEYRRASAGHTELHFTPQLDKSFNRGFTTYFLQGRSRVADMASLLTPKSMGEEISDISELHNGDGISFFNEKGEYEGVGVNGTAGGRIIGSRPFKLPKGAQIHRTNDVEWQKLMSRPATSSRRISVDMELDSTGLTLTDSRGLRARVPLKCDITPARKPFDPRPILQKLGTTIYELRHFTNHLGSDNFIAASQLAALRRRGIEALDAANLATYRYDLRRPDHAGSYISDRLEAADNVANTLAERFWRRHGVKEIEPALETQKKRAAGARVVMTTRYCLRRELGCCLRDKNVSPQRRRQYEGPLRLATGPHRFLLDFDCIGCEMRVIADD